MSLLSERQHGEVPWRSAWVTGASQGIGKALAIALCQQGVRVYASARTPAALDRLAEECRGLSGVIICCPLDITESSAITQLFEREFRASPPDLVVLNAGTHDPFLPNEFTADRVEALWHINLTGTVRCLEPALQLALSQQRGQIAIMASVAGYRGLPTAAAYGASKAALIHLAESLALDLHGTGVDLRVINPGFVRTPLTDKNDFSMPALLEPEEAAKRIINGLQGKGFEITFPRRFAWILKMLRWLPYRCYFPLVRRLTQ